MRPLRLELEGFTAFRNRTSLNFEELDLFAITGPTGAGKSSLIDAICYALYGRIPRMANQVGGAISQGLDRMQVMLEFRANGRAYKVLRETRRKGNGNIRLEQHNGDDWEPVADRATEVNRAIEQVVGLDFDAFTRSALLPQGQFQQFLAGSPEERRNVLDKLLRIDVYRRMAVRAGQEASVLNVRITSIEESLLRLADATPATRDRLKTELKQAEADARTAAAQVAALQEGLILARKLSDERTAVRRQREAQETATAALEAAQKLMAGGDEKLKRLRTDLSTVREQVETNAFDEALLDAFSAAAALALNAERSVKACREAEARLPDQEKEASAAKKIGEGAAKAVSVAKAAREAAEAAFEEAGRHNLAAMLQSTLKVGDPCPVCGGVIGELADAGGTDVDAAQRAMLAARQQEAAAAQNAATAQTKAAVAENNLANDQNAVARLKEQAKEDAVRLEEALPGIENRSSGTIKLAVEGQRELKRQRDTLVQSERALAASLSQEEQRLQGAQQQIMTAGAQLETATAAVAEAEEAAKATAAQLGGMAGANGWTEAGAELEAGRNPGNGLQAMFTTCTQRQGELQRRSGSLEQEIAQVEKNIDTAKELRDELTAKRTEHGVAADLALMLQANRFQAYVQREALNSLAEDGSRKLLELSAGRYELDVAEGGQDFMVKDRWNADDLRSVRTLSGGETFLASLALALALAETLPGLAPGRRLALESIFLDEGFGSLDPEALDRAADALDALRMEDRLVCVVTHLKELAERMPAHVVVNKSEEGSTVTVS